jgi:biotin-(acetyl-CoA carboxylase) ligase
MSGEEAGLHPLATALEAEGFSDAGSAELVEGFARHLMAALDRWQEDGFAAIAQAYAEKLERRSGERCEIDAEGDLQVRRAGKPGERRKLVPALQLPAWLDPRTGGPRL